MRHLLLTILLCGFVSTFVSNPCKAQFGGVRQPEWHEALTGNLKYLGHRNWIAIVDSAYPSQSGDSIQIEITEDNNQIEAVKTVLHQLAKSKSVRPKIYLDAELPFVPEKHAPGIDKYRADLKTLLGDRKVESLPHEKIIDKLDTVAEKFSVLIIKTNLTLPYTSVFIELDCGYWSDEAEKELRKAMADAEKK